MALELYGGGREAIGGPFIGDGYGYGGYGVVSQSIHPATAAGPLIPHMAAPPIAPISRSYISPYATPIGPPVAAAPIAAAPIAASPVAPVATTGYYGHGSYGLCPGCYGCAGGNEFFLWTVCCFFSVIFTLIILAGIIVLILWATGVF